MDKRRVLTDKFVQKVDEAIEALREITVENAEEQKVIDSRVAVLEWLKSGQAGKLVVGTPPEQKQ